MKKIVLLAACLFVYAQAVQAGPQQEKMKECNAQAKGKKGDERKAFMKSCLSGKAGDTMAADATATTTEAAAAKSADPKQRMKDCNSQAKGKKGDERKTFMSQCLKN